MDDRTIRALNESIAHWQRYADGFGKEEGEPLVHNCALCGLFYFHDCKGCPIRENTGRINCLGTVYGDAFDAYHHHGPTSPQFVDKANIMFEFLKSLLPLS